jgi:hypothetical protein
MSSFLRNCYIFIHVCIAVLSDLDFSLHFFHQYVPIGLCTDFNFLNLRFISPCVIIYSNKSTNQMHQSLSFILSFNPFVTSGTYIYVPFIKSVFKSAGITVSQFFSMLPSTLKYLYSVESVRMHFPAKQPYTNDTVCNAA